MPQSNRRVFLKQSACGLLLGPLMSFTRYVPYHHQNSWVPSESLLATIPEQLKKYGLSALSLGVIEGGKIWHKTIYTTPTSNAAKQPAYEMGSLSKPLAAVVALQLQQQGLLDLTKPLMEYVPLADLVKIPDAYKINTFHILSHSSGLQNWRFSPEDKLALSFSPGAGFSYSGEGYVWFQRIVEQLTGKGYAHYVDDYIFKPLNLVNSSFGYKEGLYEKMVPGYKKDGSLGDDYGKRIGAAMARIAQEEGSNLLHWDLTKVAAVYPDVEPNLPALPVFFGPNAAGSLVGTVQDYLRFLDVILRNHHTKLGLKRSVQEALFRPTSKVTEAISWGLGWGLARERDRQIVFHTAETRFYKGAVVLDPAQDRAILALTNGANGDRVYDKALRAATGLALTALNQF